MVSVFFGYDHRANTNINDIFYNCYKPEWFDDELVKEMVLGIDKTKVISQYCMLSPVLGQIPPLMLSGGVKTCILLYKLYEENPKTMFIPDLIVCGENCEPWLAEVFKRSKVPVRVTFSSSYFSFMGYEFTGICENDGSEITCGDDWCNKMFDLIGDWNER